MWLTYALFVILVGVVELATKFSQEMYAKMKANKKEPLSNISQKRPRAVEKELIEKALFALVIQEPKTVSPTVSLEELTPRPKKGRGGDKEIEVDKAGATVAKGNTPKAEDEALQPIA